jgi:hypothetical protein
MRSKSELAKKIVNEYKKNPKIEILNINQGKKAVDCIKILFFGENVTHAAEWAKQWNSYEKSQSIMIIYESKKTKNAIIGFKFVIGTINSGSVLGEKHNYEKGMEIIDSFKHQG